MENTIISEQTMEELKKAVQFESNMDQVTDALLCHAMKVMKNDFASLQLLDINKGGLVLIGQKNFKQESAYFWRIVYPGTGAICGEALKHRSRVAIKDVNKVSFIQGRGDMKSFEFSGIRSVQSTPLVSSRGGFVGMISTQWRTPHDFANDDYDSLDQLALFTADLLEKRKMDVVWHD